MATQSELKQRIIRQYRSETGIHDIDMKKVAGWAVKKRLVKLPAPQDPLERLAKEFSAAAREEMRYDPVTNRPYRANHHYTITQGGEQLHLWLDIDGEAPRHKMIKCRNLRREQMIGDGLQLTLDLEHWSRIHPDEEPLTADMDLTEEIEWRKNAPGDTDKKAS
jgi:hypothetical protein